MLLLGTVFTVFLVNAWSASQWYVGQSGASVAIFRGVAWNSANSELVEKSDLIVTDLPPLEQGLVSRGISVQGREGADAVVEGLRDRACSGVPQPRYCVDAVGGSAEEPQESSTPGLGGLSWEVTDCSNSEFESYAGIVFTEAKLFVRWRNVSSEAKLVTVVAKRTSLRSPFEWTDRIPIGDYVGVYVGNSVGQLDCGAKDLISVQPAE
jgi:hypothetical protein